MTEKAPLVQTIHTEKFDLEYFTFGQGARSLVILPGLSLHSVMESAAAVAAAFADFAAAYTVYVPGVRKAVPAGYTLSDLADDTAAALISLGVQNADVLGCSMGGIMAQYIAARHPELVRRLVLASTAARPNETSGAVMRAWASLASRQDRRALNRLIAEKVYSPAFRGRLAAAFALWEDQGTEAEMRDFAVLAHAVEVAEPWEELPKISAEALVIGSWDDRVFTANASMEIARRLHCPLYLYTGFGHAAYDEAPDFKKRLLDFFLSA